MTALAMAPILAWRPPRLRGLDMPLLVAVLALVSIGVAMVASASIGFPAAAGDSFHVLRRHLVFLVVSVIAASLVAQMPLRLWYAYSGWLLLGALFLLVIVLIPGVGREVNGARRWLGVGALSLQVSELAKLAVIVFIAAYLQRHQVRLREQWQGFARPMGILGIVVALLLLEPDFGSSVVIGATVLGMLFLAGVRLWQFAALLAVGLAGLMFIAVTSPYRMRRLQTFLDPWADQYASGYQLTQSLIAFGRGEWFGVGFGNSVQKLFYLPEAHTDFIFAILAEEFGLLGVVVVFALFIVVVARMFAIARQAAARQRWFAAYTALGIGILIAGQAFINVGVASGLLPTKGLTLPFVSYGGSSLLVCGVMAALVLRIGVDTAIVSSATEQVKRA